jgi:hypothetical protein
MTRFPDMFVDAYENGNVATLRDGLAERMPPDDFIIVPHHTTRTGKHGEISDSVYPGPEAMPVIEIHSKWGTSEYRGNPNPLRAVHDGPSYAADLLRRGLPLGFVAGTDTHATMASGGGHEPATGNLRALPGFTAVQAGQLSRRSLLSAIKSRSCYATSGERIALDVSIAGAGMGQVVHRKKNAEPIGVLAFAAAKEHIERVEVIRNGETIETVQPDDWRGALAASDQDDIRERAIDSPVLGRCVFYYVRVTCASGAQAWSSPVWITVDA